MESVVHPYELAERPGGPGLDGHRPLFLLRDQGHLRSDVLRTPFGLLLVSPDVLRVNLLWFHVLPSVLLLEAVRLSLDLFLDVLHQPALVEDLPFDVRDVRLMVRNVVALSR